MSAIHVKDFVEDALLSVLFSHMILGKLCFSQVPECQSCGGILKPDVVFFGDNVRRSLVDSIFDMVEECDQILVAGSSLYVSPFSVSSIF